MPFDHHEKQFGNFRFLTAPLHDTSSLSTHWGRVTHICVSKLTITGSDNGLSPDRCQAIIWINAGVLLIGPLGTNFSEILIEILAFSFKKMRLKVSSAKRRPFCLVLNVLILIRSQNPGWFISRMCILSYLLFIYKIPRWCIIWIVLFGYPCVLTNQGSN